MSFEIPENTTDILVTSNTFGRIGLTAGIDLLPNTSGVSIFQLGFPSVEAFQTALNRGAKAHIINKTVSIKCIAAGEISSSAVSTDHDQTIGADAPNSGTDAVPNIAETAVVEEIPAADQEPAAPVVEPVAPAPVKAATPVQNNSNKKR